MASKIAENAKRAHAFMAHVAELDRRSRDSGNKVKQHIGEVCRFQSDYKTSHYSPEFNCVYCGEHWQNHQTSEYNFCPTASAGQRQQTILEHQFRLGQKQEQKTGSSMWSCIELASKCLKKICPW